MSIFAPGVGALGARPRSGVCRQLKTEALFWVAAERRVDVARYMVGFEDRSAAAEE